MQAREVQQQIEKLDYMYRHASSAFEASQIRSEISRLRRVLEEVSYAPEKDPTGRRADLEDLNQMYRQAKSPKERARLRGVADAIKSEDGRTRAMRAELVKAMREGRTQDVKAISDGEKKRNGIYDTGVYDE